MRTCDLTVSVALVHIRETEEDPERVALILNGIIVGFWTPGGEWRLLSFDIGRVMDRHFDELDTLARQVWDEANGVSDG